MKYKITSDKHSYFLNVESFETNKEVIYYLISTIYFSNNVLDHIMLGRINEEEQTLKYGRFKNYTRLKQEHEIQVIISSEQKLTLDTTEKMLNIIGENILNKWSLTVWVTSFDLDGRTIYDYSFKSVEDALIFKLMFN